MWPNKLLRSDNTFHGRSFFLYIEYILYTNLSNSWFFWLYVDYLMSRFQLQCLSDGLIILNVYF